VWKETILKTELFENDVVTVTIWFPGPTADCCVFKFLRRGMDEKHLLRFQSEASVFKFLQRSVNGALNPYTSDLET